MELFLPFPNEFIDVLSDLLDCWVFVPLLLTLLEEQSGNC